MIILSIILKQNIFNKEKEIKDIILKNSPLEEELILKKGCPKYKFSK